MINGTVVTRPGLVIPGQQVAKATVTVYLSGGQIGANVKTEGPNALLVKTLRQVLAKLEARHPDAADPLSTTVPN